MDNIKVVWFLIWLDMVIFNWQINEAYIYIYYIILRKMIKSQLKLI